MMMISSRIQSRGRISVPPEVCEALGLKAGDMLHYDIDGDRVILSRGEAAGEDRLEDDDLTDLQLAPVIDAAIADRRPTLLIDDAFAEVRSRIRERGGRVRAA